MKIKIRVLCIGIILALLNITGASANTVNKLSALGINTNEAMDINSSMPFVNLFKLSLPFEHARPWLTKGKILYDKNGWPKNLNGGQAGTRFISNLPAGTIPAGLYTVLYKGKGKLEYRVDATLVSSTPGKDIISIKPGKNGRISATIIIKESDPRNYIRDIEILMPGGICMGEPFKRVNEQRQCGARKFLSFEEHHNRILFNPDYLHFMKDFKVIRFMNMSGITRNGLSQWKDRPKMTQATWGGKEGVRGVPLEVMVELANQINADPWFNLPHKADDSFVWNYAQYVKNNLKPDLKPYIEYTNEAWNGIFSQAHYMKDMGTKLKLDTNRDQAGYKFFSQRSVEIFKIWERVFGDADHIVRVMGAFTNNKRLSETLLKHKNAYKHTDALAIAPYFYMDQKETMRIRSVDTVFKRLTAKDNRYSIPNVLQSVKEQAKIAKKYGINLVAYEGGQHLVAYKTHTVREGPNPFLIYANKDKRMAQLYYQFLQGWKDAGGELFVAFSAPRLYTWIGSWGIKEYITQPAGEAPKYQALMAFNKNNPCWWEGCRTRERRNVVPASLASTSNSVHKKKIPHDPFHMPVKPKYRVNSSYYAGPSKRVQQDRKPQVMKASHVAKNAIGSLTNILDRKLNRIPRAMNSQQPFQRNSPFRLMTPLSGDLKNSLDLAGHWQGSWDQQHLHIRVEVGDDSMIKDSAEPWGDDSIEVYIDADGSQLSSYDRKNDYQLIFRLHDYTIGIGKNSPQRPLQGVRHRVFPVNGGYVLEASIPWRTLGVKPVEGNTVGIEVQINDDDDGNERDAKLAWNATEDTAWHNPQSFGQITLSD